MADRILISSDKTIAGSSEIFFVHGLESYVKKRDEMKISF